MEQVTFSTQLNHLQPHWSLKIWRRYVLLYSTTWSIHLCLSPQLRRSDLVESIKMMKMMDDSYKCEKMIRGRPGSVIPSSYIVMMKGDSNMTEMVSGYSSVLSFSVIPIVVRWWPLVVHQVTWIILWWLMVLKNSTLHNFMGCLWKWIMKELIW